jgi:hypothetical protein
MEPSHDKTTDIGVADTTDDTATTDPVTEAPAPEVPTDTDQEPETE